MLNHDVPAKAVALSVQPAERIGALDVLRGIAVCGILIMNLPYFARSGYAEDPRVYNELTHTANRYTWLVVDFLLEGSMRGLFSLLFGASAVLILARLEKRFEGMLAAELYVRRLIWLLIFGLINGYVFIWAGDILYHYAITGLFLIPFRNAKPRLLLGLAGFFVVVTFLTSALSRTEFLNMRKEGIAAQEAKKNEQQLSEKQQEALANWEDYLKESDVTEKRKKADEELKTISTGTYGDVWKEWTVWTTKLETTKFHNDMFFDIIIFFLLGIFLYRKGILTGAKSARFYFALMLAGYSVGIGLGLWEYRIVIKSGLDPYLYYKLWELPFNPYQLHRLGTTLGHMGLILLILKFGIGRKVLSPFARMGQMAFSNYLLQSIVSLFLFTGVGLGLFGRFERFELWGVWALYVLVLMLFSAVWLRFFAYGPFEWVWRSLTFWKRLPIRRLSTTKH